MATNKREGPYESDAAAEESSEEVFFERAVDIGRAAVASTLWRANVCMTIFIKAGGNNENKWWMTVCNFILLHHFKRLYNFSEDVHRHILSSPQLINFVCTLLVWISDVFHFPSGLI